MPRIRDRLRRGLDDRFDFGNRVLVPLSARTVPAPSRRFWYCFGGLALVAAVMQALSGMFLAFYYQPTPEDAHASVFYISNYVRYGWLIRSVHVWGARLMILLVVAHMTRVYLTASYKRPRELNWVAGVLLLAVTMGFMITGDLLPWDSNGYSATLAFVGLARSVPVFGNALASLWLGGESVGASALTRFYAAHIMLLPAVGSLLLFLHFMMVRRLRISRPL